MNSHSKAIATLVLGIIGIVSCFGGGLGIFGLGCAIVGVVFGIQVKKELPESDPDYKLAQAGFICSVIGVAAASLGVISCVACVSCGALSGMMYY